MRQACKDIARERLSINGVTSRVDSLRGMFIAIRAAAKAETGAIPDAVLHQISEHLLIRASRSNSGASGFAAISDLFDLDPQDPRKPVLMQREGPMHPLRVDVMADPEGQRIKGFVITTSLFALYRLASDGELELVLRLDVRVTEVVCFTHAGERNDAMSLAWLSIASPDVVSEEDLVEERVAEVL